MEKVERARRELDVVRSVILLVLMYPNMVMILIPGGRCQTRAPALSQEKAGNVGSCRNLRPRDGKIYAAWVAKVSEMGELNLRVLNLF